MAGFSWSIALSLLAVACSAVALVLAGARTPTAIARTAEKNVAEAMSRWQSEIKLFEATRDRWTSEFAGIAERCDELLDRSESKRRRIAASESKANAAANADSADPPWANMSRAEIIDYGRRRLRGVA